jgi:beta-lactamase regulating signal transducer with metallopeptidase domain
VNLGQMNLDALAPMLTVGMLNCMLEGAAIAGCAWLALWAMGRRNAGTRFAVWLLALLAIPALPWLDLLFATRTGHAVENTHAALLLPRSWALDIFVLWGVIAGAALLRIGIGLWQVRKVRQSCRPVDVTTLDPVLQKTLAEFHSIRPVTLCVSDSIRVPTAIGFFKPVVVIPAWAMQELSADDLKVILLHELAHLRRWDDCTNLVQKVLRAVLFFHPAVWWIENRLSLEREMACDDLVLAQTANPRAYAHCLISVAEKSFLHRGLALAQAAVSRMRHTSLRVTLILDANRPGATRIWKPAIGLVSGFAVVCAVSFARAPRLIAFQDQVPQIVASSSLPAAAAIPEPSLGNVVSVGLRIRKTNTGARAVSSRPALARVTKHTDEPVAAEAMKAELFQTQPLIVPDFVLANLPGATAAVAPTDTVFVFVQGEQFGQAGPVFWTVTVWHVTIQHSGKTPVPAENSAKSI